MMKLLRSLILLTLPFHFYLNTQAQVGHSTVIDSLMQEIDFDSLMLLNRQLTGDTSVVIDGVTETIVSRHSAHPGNALAAQFILEKFQSAGLSARFMDYDDNGQNVIATKTGYQFPEKQFIICAHYDNLPSGSVAYGADDNASGVCAVLEAARLAAGYSFPYTLKFIAFDEEEQGIIGSTAYADSAIANDDEILAVLNLDMIAWDSDGDHALSVSANDPSMPLLVDVMSCIRVYQPDLSPNYASSGSSDHSSFWQKSFNAILLIEDFNDFNPYYHSLSDNFGNINQDFFYRMTRLAVATLFTWGLDFRMELSHDPLPNTVLPGERTATLIIDPERTATAGANAPRLYYQVDGGAFNELQSSYVNQDTMKFTIPGFPYGTQVSYYFAAQDNTSMYVCSLPEGAKGVAPPGASVPPGNLFSYTILRHDTQSFSASGLPVNFPGFDSTTVEISVPTSGRMLDLDVTVSIQKYRAWDLSLFLISPDGQQIELSSNNGYIESNYSNTTFDDEAPTYITQHHAPFTGSFKPEQPLSCLQGAPMAGIWTLKVSDGFAFGGQITAFTLTFTYANSDLYVDAAIQVSGDGLSWASALKTISEACQLDPSPGTNVFIQPGTYQESVNIISNGESVIPLTTGISVQSNHVIQFPAGTDLSAIDLSTHPGEYFAYIYRSRLRNSGYYQVIDVDDELDLVYVDGAVFLPESGVAGDQGTLCCAVARPVVYKKYSGDPENERVIIDASQDTSIHTVLYVGTPQGDGLLDAFPASFNIIDGLDITGSQEGNGVHLQSSSFNILMNSRIYCNAGTGLHVGGNLERQANNNFILGNDIYNAPLGGIEIGNSEQPEDYNHAHYNHLMGNDLFMVEDQPNAQMDPAIAIRENNTGSVIRDNHIHNISMAADESSSLLISTGTHHTLIFGNNFRDVTSTGSGYNSLVRVLPYNQHVEVFNNILSDSIPISDGMFAFRLDGTGTDSCRVVHNTVYQIAQGLLLEDYTTISDYHIKNNIIHTVDSYYTHLGYEGRYDVSHNLYPTDPTPDSNMAYYDEDGRQVGEVEFLDPDAGNFHLTIGSDPALCTGVKLVPVISIDPDRELRYADAPDIGAFELENKIVWEGSVSHEWDDPVNWAPQGVPNSLSNVIIENADLSPRINTGSYTVKGIFLGEDSHLNIQAPAVLIISTL